jgi:hypothetical protein
MMFVHLANLNFLQGYWGGHFSGQGLDQNENENEK